MLLERVRFFIWLSLATATITLAGQMSARSQAGSAGGSVGETDKTVSGVRKAPPERNERAVQKPIGDNSPKSEALPNSIRIIERYGLTYTITLRKTAERTYQGTWSHGYATTFTVTEFTPRALNMQREDKPAFGAVTGTYTASRSGNTAHGQAVISNGAESAWDATW
jgi:hypothetical protein